MILELLKRYNYIKFIKKIPSLYFKRISKVSKYLKKISFTSLTLDWIIHLKILY